MNPWTKVDLNDYERHMSLESVAQLQVLNEMMRTQIYDYAVSDIMILGIAGGNGLNHIDTSIIQRVYGVDINAGYLSSCRERFINLGNIFTTIQADLTDETIELPHADLVIANLILEYIGYASFVQNIRHIAPKYVSVIIQINKGEGFVSDSPYIHSFDSLNEIYNRIDSAALIEIMMNSDYTLLKTSKRNLPNNKAFERLDFCIRS